MVSNQLLTTKRLLKSLCRLLPLGSIAVVMMPGVNADAGDKHIFGSGNSGFHSFVAVNGDTGPGVGETEVISNTSNVNYNNGNLSVSLDDSPLHQVLTEISRQTGIDFRFIGEHPASTVKMQFSDVPLETSLRLLLREASTIFIHEDRDANGIHGRQLTKVFILPIGENSKSDNGTVNAIENLSGISERIQISIPPSYVNINPNSSTIPLNTDQVLKELSETLTKKINHLGRAE